MRGKQRKKEDQEEERRGKKKREKEKEEEGSFLSSVNFSPREADRSWELFLRLSSPVF